MHPIFLVAAGGALGSVSRYLMVLTIDQRWPIGFPLGTLLVNVLGSFLIGLIAGLTDHKSWQLFLMVGIMGGFTTFSSFSLQTFRLMQDGRWGAVTLYVLLSVACCLLGTWGGQALARTLSPIPTP